MMKKGKEGRRLQAFCRPLALGPALVSQPFCAGAASGAADSEHEKLIEMAGCRERFEDLHRVAPLL